MHHLFKCAFISSCSITCSCELPADYVNYIHLFHASQYSRTASVTYIDVFFATEVGGAERVASVGMAVGLGSFQ